METVQVALGARSYNIEIGINLLEEVGSRLASLVKGRQAALITDSNVGPIYAERVTKSLEKAGFQVLLLTIPAGESSKNWQMAGDLLGDLLAAGFHRDSTVLALGGGVVGDLAGFVASVYQRGVGFVQIPTSLLAQVDSSVGGKVAVNHKLGKNMLGAFYQPLAVWIDLSVLETLEERHWRNGLAEVIKYGVLGDAEFFAFLQKNQEALAQRAKPEVAQMIASCCRQKAAIVAEDERESGVRAKLNYGHTIAHGLEYATHYQGYLHGEAVAIGMVLAAELAEIMQIAESDTKAQVRNLLEAYQLPVALDSSLSVEDILQGMALDKKVQDGQWVFILPEKIGHARIEKGISREIVKKLLEKR